MRYRVSNASRDKILADRAVQASSFWDRLIGLMGRRELAFGEGLRLLPCNGIHTFFMRIPIDAAFLDQAGKVLRVHHALRPWRVTTPHPRARSVLELPAGTLEASGTQVGDVLRFEPEEERHHPQTDL